MRLPDDGVKPAVVERYTRYSVTPTLSEDAAQSSLAPSGRAVAVSEAGAEGAVTSPVASTRTIWPMDGTPLSSTRKTMYQPGGATLALAGPVIWTLSLVLVKLSGTRR